MEIKVQYVSVAMVLQSRQYSNTDYASMADAFLSVNSAKEFCTLSDTNSVLLRLSLAENSDRPRSGKAEFFA